MITSFFNADVKAKILVVDDQPVNIQIIHQILSAEYQIFMATSGAQAIQLCLSNPPDLILLDVMMPELDGLETCRLLKKQDGLATVPVVFVTGLQSQDEENECWDAGGSDFLIKPVNPVTLKNRVRAQLRLKLQNDLLQQLAFSDALTGLYNRRYANEFFENQNAVCQRSSMPLVVLMIDIDFFKAYNDCYGHLKGDECLIAVAQQLKTGLQRSSDLVARYGGEEFICILPGISMAEAKTLSQSLVDSVAALDLEHQQSPLGKVTISLGYASSECSTELLHDADLALYQSKHNGKNRAVGFE